MRRCLVVDDDETQRQAILDLVGGDGDVEIVAVGSSEEALAALESEPRFDEMVPSSTTVTPLAATCWPINPENAEVCLRLKSPSSPWPIASCSTYPRRGRPSVDCG